MVVIPHGLSSLGAAPPAGSVVAPPTLVSFGQGNVSRAQSSRERTKKPGHRSSGRVGSLCILGLENVLDIEREQDIERLRQLALGQKRPLERMVEILARKCEELQALKGNASELQLALKMLPDDAMRAGRGRAGLPNPFLSGEASRGGAQT